MKTKSNSKDAWERLAKMAAQPAPAEAGAEEMPLGFGSRVIAQWCSQKERDRGGWEVLEWLTLRGLAVAALVLVGSAALSYDALSGIFTTDLSQAAEVISSTFEL